MSEGIGITASECSSFGEEFTILEWLVAYPSGEVELEYLATDGEDMGSYSETLEIDNRERLFW